MQIIELLPIEKFYTNNMHWLKL